MMGDDQVPPIITRANRAGDDPNSPAHPPRESARQDSDELDLLPRPGTVRISAYRTHEERRRRKVLAFVLPTFALVVILISVAATRNKPIASATLQPNHPSPSSTATQPVDATLPPSHADPNSTAIQPVDTTFPRAPDAPAGSGPSWDEIKNAAIPEACDHPPTTLVDGHDVTLSERQGHFELKPTLRNGQPGLIQGVPSEAGPLTAVVVSCHAGGVAWPNQIMLFSAGGDYYASTDLRDTDWAQFSLRSPAQEGVVSIGLQGAEIEVHTIAERDGEAMCCPTGSATVRMRAADRTIQITGLEDTSGN